MKFKHIFISSMFLCTALLQNSAQSRTNEEIMRDLIKATNTAVETYREQGMAGLVTKTQSCYKKNTKNLFYCVYLDLASRRIDQLFVESMKFPPNTFFADKKFGSRIGPVLFAADMDMDTANEYLATITPVINGLVEKRL